MNGTTVNSSGATVDGVERGSHNGINVLVIGAGVGGLLTALECWRKGCDVVVLERADAISPIGDFFTIPPSGMCTLKHYPAMFDAYHERVFDCSISIWRPDGTLVKQAYPEWRRPGAREKSAAPDVSISFIKQRPVFTTMLYEQCLRLDIPVLFRKKAVEATEDGNGVEVLTQDGMKYVADLCVASVGIGSSFAQILAMPDAPVLDSGYAIARMAFPRSAIESNSPAAELLKNIDTHPEFRVYLGEDLHLILFLTADFVAFAYTHESDGHAAESWHNLRDPSTFIEQLETKSENWDPAVIDFIKQAPDQVVDWGLRWRDPVEQWTSEKGRVVKLGDAAHAFLPTAGNGAVQACEDAISLAECLRQGGKAGVCRSVKVHNKLRFQRTSVLQQAGFINREELHHSDLDAIARHPEAEVGFFKHGRWVWGHDPEKYAAENYKSCLEHVLNGTPFENTNLPPGHIFRPWSMESENQRMAAGVKSDLKRNGDWSAM